MAEYVGRPASRCENSADRPPTRHDHRARVGEHGSGRHHPAAARAGRDVARLRASPRSCGGKGSQPGDRRGRAAGAAVGGTVRFLGAVGRGRVRRGELRANLVGRRGARRPAPQGRRAERHRRRSGRRRGREHHRRGARCERDDHPADEPRTSGRWPHPVGPGGLPAGDPDADRDARRRDRGRRPGSRCCSTRLRCSRCPRRCWPTRRCWC